MNQDTSSRQSAPSLGQYTIMFANHSRSSGRQGALSGQARDRKRRPSLETLEGRQLMSLGAEFISPINTTTRNFQYESDNATSADGSSVVVWTDQFSSTDLDIRAQRYNSFGGKLGPEIIVAYTGLSEYAPSVAIDDQGQFVVSYTQAVGGDTNILAQRFDSNGNALGAPIQVGAGTFAESDSDVAMDRYGNFVVSYTRNTNNNNPDIFAKQYNSNGQLLNVVNVATSSVAEYHSSVAMTPDGRFDVAWEQYLRLRRQRYLSETLQRFRRPARDQRDLLQHRLRHDTERLDGQRRRRGGGLVAEP